MFLPLCILIVSKQIAPQFVPQNVTAVPLDSKSIKVSWNIPSTAMTKSMFIEGFYVGYKVYSSSDSFTYKTMHILPSSNSNTHHESSSSRRVSHSPSMSTSISSSSMSSSTLLSISSASSGSSSSSSSGKMFAHSQSASGRKYEYTVDLLRKSTKYAILIQAFNSRGAGPSSPEVTVETYANGML